PQQRTIINKQKHTFITIFLLQLMWWKEKQRTKKSNNALYQVMKKLNIVPPPIVYEENKKPYVQLSDDLLQETHKSIQQYQCDKDKNIENIKEIIRLHTERLEILETAEIPKEFEQDLKAWKEKLLKNKKTFENLYKKEERLKKISEVKIMIMKQQIIDDL